MNEPITKGWHLRKEVSVGHMLTTVVVVAGLFTYLSSIENRVSVNEQRIDNINSRMDRSDRRLERDMGEIKSALNRIEDRLNRSPGE